MSVSSVLEHKPSAKYSDHALISSDRSILSSRSVEIIPRESSTFGYQNASGDVSSDTLNDKMTFAISDPRHYLDLENSYIQCVFKARATTNDPFPLEAFLDHGGIHSCIRTVILRHGSAEIHRIDDYSKLYNAIKFASRSPDYVDKMLGSSGDSWRDQYEFDDGDYVPWRIGQTTASLAYDVTGGAAEKLLTLGANGDAYNELAPGDLLLCSFGDVGADIDPYTRMCVVTSIVSATTITVDGLGDTDIAAGAAGAFKEVRLLKRGGLAARRRVVQSSTVANLDEHRLVFQIPLGMFGLDRYFPLPFLNQPLELTLEFQHPALCIVAPRKDGGVDGPDQSSATTNLLGYAITRPRFVARMIEPSGDVFDAHKRMWMEDGLVYRMNGIRAFTNQLAAQGTEYNITFQSNIKSVIAALCVSVVQSTQSAAGNSAATQQAYAQSAFLKDNLQSFRFRCGGLSFPDYGECNVNDPSAGQAWNQLQMVVGNLMDNQGGCIPAWKWADVRSDKFVIGMRFQKELGVYNTGVDASSNYLELELVYPAYAAGPPVVGVDANRSFVTWLMYDQVAILHKDSGLRLFY